jgi:hypothetical protein
LVFWGRRAARPGEGIERLQFVSEICGLPGKIPNGRILNAFSPT